MRLRRALTAAGLAGALGLAAACSGAGPERAADPPAGEPTTSGAGGSAEPATPVPAAPATSGTPVPEAPASGSTGAADLQDFAVAPPGPRKDDLQAPDILVFSQDTLPEGVVRRIADVEGVVDVEQLSIGQVPVENKALNVAAVDPGSYRLWTELVSADFQEAWDRVAGGELAVAPALQDKLPLDEQGFLGLGPGEEAPSVHVGAYAPQVPNVDAVVNERWGEALGIPQGNALLVSTRITSPEAVRGPVQRIAGGAASVQRLDLVARLGIDPDVQQTAVPVGSAGDVVGTFSYSVLGGGRIAPDPGWVSSHIATEAVPILGEVTCNRYLFPQLRAALTEVVERGLADAINPGEYAGCYYPRFIAGTTTLSNHSFGLALDFNVPGNLRGTVGEMDRTVVAIFKKWGFAWGGDWRFTDPMHFEMARLVEPQ